MEKMKFYSLKICALIVLIFIIQTFVSEFTNLFVLNNQSFFQPWRFVTAIFLHGSIQHLLGNLFAIFFFGIILEKTIGSKKFLLVYLISGILANLVAINFYSNSLGASGAIMGIIGALTILRPMTNVWAFGLIMPMFVAAIVWVIVDSVGLFIPSNIGHIAHLSGILFGGIFGIIMRSRNKNKKNNKINLPETLIRRWEKTYLND